MCIECANSIYIFIGVLILIALVYGVFHRRNGGDGGHITKAQKAEQEEFAVRWDEACKTRTALGLHPEKYDINSCDNYRANPPTESADEAMHRVVRGVIGEAREEFKKVNR